MTDSTHFESKLWEKVFPLAQDNETQNNYKDLLYHYTTPEGLLGILQSQNIWATEATFLNDLYEIQYGLEITQEVLNIYIKNKSDFIKDFSQLTLYYFHLMNSKEEEIYITSFCEKSDLLSQWKGYTNFGEGYAIGLELGKLINSKKSKEFDHVSIKKVIYDQRIQTKMVKSKIDLMIHQSQKLIQEDIPNKKNIIQASAKSLAYHLNTQSKRFKSSVFKEEKEWRAIYINSTLSKNKRIKNQFRMADSTIVPYIELHLCKKAHKSCNSLPINEIIIGPKIDFKKAAKSINLVYKNLLIKLPVIKESNISLQ